MQIGNLTALEELHLEDNKLTGKEISYNSVYQKNDGLCSGLIPVELENLVSLTALNSQNNNFEGITQIFMVSYSNYSSIYVMIIL